MNFDTGTYKTACGSLCLCFKSK